jgi:hypothetical protein
VGSLPSSRLPVPPQCWQQLEIVPDREQVLRRWPPPAPQAGGGCKAGYDTETSVLTPPDDSTGDNPAAGSVTFTKSCTGAVVGQFTSETSIPSGGFIHLDMIATCIGTGGFSTHCTVGQTVFGQRATRSLHKIRRRASRLMRWTWCGRDSSRVNGPSTYAREATAPHSWTSALSSSKPSTEADLPQEVRLHSCHCNRRRKGPGFGSGADPTSRSSPSYDHPPLTL